MNLVAQYPNITPLNMHVQVESAQREAATREILPATTQSSNQSLDNEIDSKREREKTQNSNRYEFEKSETNDDDLTYSPQAIRSKQRSDHEGNSESDDTSSNDKQNKDKSANGEVLSDEQQRKLDNLKARDTEVKIHEQKHKSVGGQYASSPSYTTEKGPDGREYAVEGEVKISITEESSPQETVTKMQKVAAAALAPAEPSSQDRSVANQARKLENKARMEINQEKQNSLSNPENKGEEGDNKLSKHQLLRQSVVASRYNNSWSVSNSSFQAYA